METKTINRLIEAINRLTTAVERHNTHNTTLGKCKGCLGSGLGYGEKTCIKCGGSGLFDPE